MGNDNSDKTAMIGLDQETINRELQKAKEQPACLIMIRGHDQGHRYFIDKDEILIGRDPASCDFYIPDPLISRAFAK